MTSHAVRDGIGRHYPAHLDTRHGDVWWWHGSERYSRRRPRYTFDRDRSERDERRAFVGTPPDHQEPQPGDGLEERARARREAAEAAEAARRTRWRQQWLEGLRNGRLPEPDPVCWCPADCEALLFAEEPLPPRLQAVPHVDDCPCRCDIA